MTKPLGQIGRRAMELGGFPPRLECNLAEHHVTERNIPDIDNPVLKELRLIEAMRKLDPDLARLLAMEAASLSSWGEMMLGCNDATGDCHKCRWWRGLANRNPGVRIPNPHPDHDGCKFGHGKCLRPEGHCTPGKVR